MLTVHRRRTALRLQVASPVRLTSGHISTLLGIQHTNNELILILIGAMRTGWGMHPASLFQDRATCVLTLNSLIVNFLCSFPSSYAARDEAAVDNSNNADSANGANNYFPGFPFPGFPFPYKPSPPPFPFPSPGHQSVLLFTDHSLHKDLNTTCLATTLEMKRRPTIQTTRTVRTITSPVSRSQASRSLTSRSRSPAISSSNLNLLMFLIQNANTALL
jgi:hypothetical protein